jgi:hypothetical protein
MHFDRMFEVSHSGRMSSSRGPFDTSPVGGLCR